MQAIATLTSMDNDLVELNQVTIYRQYGTMFWHAFLYIIPVQ